MRPATSRHAHLEVLPADYLSVPDDEIKQLEFVLTIVGGNPVYGAEEFSGPAPRAPPVLPEWSPRAAFGGYAKFHVVLVTAHCTDHAFSGRFRCFCWAF
jgi:hypothetical protein